MCTHRHWIENKYTGQKILVNCGRCPSCMQEKAASLSDRLRNTKARNVYFLTLTYTNRYVPYIRRCDLLNTYDIDSIPVYRDGVVERKLCYTVGADGKKVPKVRNGYRVYRNIYKSKPHTLVDTCRFDLHEFFALHPSDDSRSFLEKEVSFLKHASRHPQKDALAVIYYPDFQNFVKRFKQNVERVLKKDCTNATNKFFICTEYGPDTHRAHAHILLFSENLSFQDVKYTLLKSWPYADFRQLSKYCEVARDPSGYVASYVNCADGLSDLFRCSPFRPKHSFSQGIGLDSDYFLPSRILEKLQRGDLTYPVKKVKDGVPYYDDVLLPSYVSGRYFPRFKGYFKLSSDSVYELLHSLTFLSLYGKKYLEYKSEPRVRKCSFGYPVRNYEKVMVDDASLVNARLRNAYNRLSAKLPGYTLFDYFHDYVEFHRCRSQSVLKVFYENKEHVPEVQRYDNIQDLVDGSVRNDSLWSFVTGNVETDPNKFTHNVNRSLRNAFWFDKYSKYRKVTNVQMAAQGHNV